MPRSDSDLCPALIDVGSAELDAAPGLLAQCHATTGKLKHEVSQRGWCFCMWEAVATEAKQLRKGLLVNGNRCT